MSLPAAMISSCPARVSLGETIALMTPSATPMVAVLIPSGCTRRPSRMMTSNIIRLTGEPVQGVTAFLDNPLVQLRDGGFQPRELAARRKTRPIRLLQRHDGDL